MPRPEQLFEDLGRHAGAGVGDLDEDLAVGRGRRRHRDRVLMGVPLGDRLGRVDDQVEEHLPQPRLAGVDHRRRRIEDLDQPGPMPDLVPRHPQHRLHDGHHVDGPDQLFLGSGEDLQVAHDRAQPLGALVRVVEHLAQLAVLGREPVALGQLDDVAGRQLEVGRHARQRVVQLVGDARGQEAHRGHAFGDEELLLHLLALGAQRGVA